MADPEAYVKTAAEQYYRDLTMLLDVFWARQVAESSFKCQPESLSLTRMSTLLDADF